MLNRVSSNLLNDDMQFYARQREAAIASMGNKMGTQKRIENLRDDPLGAARAVRYDSDVKHLERFEKNAQYVQDNYNITEGHLNEAIDILQRVRELAVKGANGTYTKEDMQYMGKEVNELLNELVHVGNARGADGSFIFSGEKLHTEPFAVTMGTAPESDENVITEVRYQGGLGGPVAETTQNNYVEMNIPGSQAFWAQQQELRSNVDARNWSAQNDSRIAIDNVAIDIKAGDNIYAVVAKINNSGAAVKASVDPQSFSLNIVGTTAHEVRLEDLAITDRPTVPASLVGVGVQAGPTQVTNGVLTELGLIAPNGFNPSAPASGASITGGSTFEALIHLRDALNSGNSEEVGGSALGAIDSALNNTLRNLAELGARSERLETTSKRLNQEIPNATALFANENDLDVTTAITDYRMLENANRVALGFAGKAFPPTLLDFLR